MFKKSLILLFTGLIITTQSVQSETFKKTVSIPDANIVSYTPKSANELQEKFNKAVMSDNVIQTYLQYIAKDLNKEIVGFQIKNNMIKFWTTVSSKDKEMIKEYVKKSNVEDGYYFMTYYKEGKGIVLGRFLIDVTSSAIRQTPATSFIPSQLGNWLKDLFGITKVKQLKKFSIYYDKIVERMTVIIMQQVLYNKDELNAGVIIRNCNVIINSSTAKVKIEESLVRIE